MFEFPLFTISARMKMKRIFKKEKSIQILKILSLIENI